MRILFPYSRKGINSKEKIAISIPNIPNGIAGPDSADHVPTKNVQEKLTIARRHTIATKQSPEMAL